VKHLCLGKLAGVGVLVGFCGAGLSAAERETAAQAVHLGSTVTSPAVRALENDTLIALKRVHFASGSSDVKNDEKAVLDSLTSSLSGSSRWVIELRGYSDSAGSSGQNLALSLGRTNSIARLLSERGIPMQRILTIGLGEVDPNGPVLDPEHERVDIRIFVPPATAKSLRIVTAASAGK
jgi:outer membrane protein OmpA-like peptidoglycan-associated protein